MLFERARQTRCDCAGSRFKPLVAIGHNQRVLDLISDDIYWANRTAGVRNIPGRKIVATKIAKCSRRISCCKISVAK